MDDEFAPALDTPASDREASDVDHHERHEGAPIDGEPASASAPAPAKAAPRRGDDPNVPLPDSTGETRAQRSSAWRGMFRDLSAKVKSGEVSIESDDLVPVEHAPAPAPVAAPAAAAAAPVEPPPVANIPASASPAAQAAAALPVPVPRAAAPAPIPLQPPAANLPAIPQADTRIAELERREKEIQAREAALEARAKKLPTRERMIEAPVPTLADYIKETYGITDDGELKDTITDLMTEMSELYHGVKLPDEIKARVDGRKALRTVKAIRSTVDRDRAELAERETAARKTADEARQQAEVDEYERKAVGQLTTLLTPVETTYPFLAVQDAPAAIVWEVMKAALDQGHKLTWDQAAGYANTHYQTEHEQAQAEAAKRAARLNTLLAPPAPAAQAKPAASPGGAPGPAPKQPAATAQPTPAPEPTVADTEDALVHEDRRERRARSLRGLAKRHGLTPDAS